MDRPTIARVGVDAAGCWVDGCHGQYACALMVSHAVAHGYPINDSDQIILDHVMANGESAVSDDDRFSYDYLLIEAESWLNQHVSPAGYQFGWHDGEFFLQSDEWWDE